MTRYKLIFAGGMGAGKTTAIRAISDITPVSTDVENLDLTQHEKSLTTVGIDYGIVQLDSQTEVQIYGTPGQQRFDFVWKVVQQGALGTVLFVDHMAKEPLAQLVYYVEHYLQDDPQTRLVIAVTHLDEAAAMHTQRYFDLLAERQWTIPLFFIDARERQQVAMVVNALLSMIEAQIA